MDQGKVKRLWPRTLSPEVAPPEQRRAPRLASEPMSRRVRQTDRWTEGFLRLEGAATERALSYIVDGLGVYYDATAPSELEVMLEEGGWESPALIARAEAGIAELRRMEISLDNDPRRSRLEDVLGVEREAGTRRVVIVDQPRGDPAIGFGLAGEARFATMLETALVENPGAELVVVMDPAAHRHPGRGHLDALAEAKGARVVRDPITAWSLVGACDAVYVVTAHVGFEAAMAGLPVVCFGVPFYAGWGFTDDRLHLARRTRPRGAVEVFAAAYLVASRYYEPYEGEPCAFEEALAILGLAVTRSRENAVRTLCLGFPSWKRPWIARTLASPGSAPGIAPKGKASVSPDDLEGFGRVVAWASRAPAEVGAACARAGVPLLRMEDGFLRSIGLGVALRPGASYVLDATGIYYDATSPSDLERILQEERFDDALLERAARLRTAIVEARISKYNVGAAPMPALPSGRPVVLVAGQVEDDASIRLGASRVRTNADLLRAAREGNPGALIAFKPHPDVEAGLRPGRVSPSDLATLADVALRDVAAPDAIEAADRVEVITSLLGFEALLRGKPVTTHGLPFYAGWGLTEGETSPRRTRRLDLDALVAGALIRYTRYLDPRTGLPCPPEVVVRRLADGDPGLARRERTLEAALKQVWSIAFRRLLRRGG